jgi:hypothetical protein
MKQAEELAGDHGVELWQRDRKIAKYVGLSDDPRERPKRAGTAIGTVAPDGEGDH